MNTKTLNEWLEQYREHGGSGDWEYTEHIMRDAFPTALKIIRELAEAWDTDDARLIAERIINEQ